LSQLDGRESEAVESLIAQHGACHALESAFM
jgi:hypothetical protein